MAWASNWTSSEGAGKIVGIALEELRLALVERATATEYTLNAALTSELTINSLPDVNWFTQFQTAMSALIPKFIDHTDSGGTWDGETSIPVWSEADLLTEIGDASRVSSPALEELVSANWVYQQYELLDLMRWVKATTNDPVDPNVDSLTVETKTVTSAASWAACETALGSASWSNAGGINYYRSSSVNPDWYIDTVRHVWALSNATFDFAVDYYYLSANTPGQDWLAVGNADQDDKYNLCRQSSVAASHSITQFEDGELTGLSDPAGAGTNWYSNQSNSEILVLKFDDTGGFSYVST